MKEVFRFPSVLADDDDVEVDVVVVVVLANSLKRPVLLSGVEFF